jgi:hypothetical protein
MNQQVRYSLISDQSSRSMLDRLGDEDSRAGSQSGDSPGCPAMAEAGADTNTVWKLENLDLGHFVSTQNHHPGMALPASGGGSSLSRLMTSVHDSPPPIDLEATASFNCLLDSTQNPCPNLKQGRESHKTIVMHGSSPETGMSPPDFRTWDVTITLRNGARVTP